MSDAVIQQLSQTPPRLRRTRSTGFTILELALSLAILAALASAVLVPFVAQVTQRNIAGTERILDDAKETLMGYATANGRFPCPATANSNGVEVFVAGTGNTVNGNCFTFWGFLPAATLGFTPIDSAGFAIDAWGTQQNRIRYAVANINIGGAAGTNTFTRTDGMRVATAAGMAAATAPPAAAANTLLNVCASGNGGALMTAGTSCGTAVRLTDNAPVVIWSVGANAATGGTSTDELQNPNPNGGSADRIFVMHPMTTTTGNEFDDIVTWLSVGNLVSRMVLGGRLP